MTGFQSKEEFHKASALSARRGGKRFEKTNISYRLRLTHEGGEKGKKSGAQQIRKTVRKYLISQQ